jgi:predicted Zn finger-like uncharacterized protein
MIVECSHCQTKFNLPDDKIKPEGVKIRCTRCKNVFDVSPPKRTPSLDDSLSAGFDDDLSGFDEGTDDLSPEGAADSDLSEDLDGDIGSDDINLDGDDSDFSLDSDLDIGSEDAKMTDSDSLEFDMESPEETGAGLDSAPASAGRTDTKAAAESDFTLEEDLNSDLGDLDLSFDDGPAQAGKKTAPDAGSDFDLSFAREPAAAGIDSSPIPAARPTAGKTMNDDFGIGDDSMLGGKDDLGFGDSIGINTEHDPFADIGEPVPVARKKKKATRRSPLMVALLILLFLAAGGYWVYSTYLSKGFDPEQILSLFSSNEDPLANLENAEMKMHYYYVMNGELGKILVLEGMVVNHSKYEKGRVKVRLTLYDKSGKELGNTESYCGNILDVHELETLPKADIVKLLSVEAGKKLNNAQLKSNESIPYMMVVFSVPEGTDGFVVTVVGAQNVGK